MDSDDERASGTAKKVTVIGGCMNQGWFLAAKKQRKGHREIFPPGIIAINPITIDMLFYHFVDHISSVSGCHGAYDSIFVRIHGVFPSSQSMSLT